MDRLEHSLWVEKYRPKDLSTYIGNELLKSKVVIYLESEDVPHLLLYGRAGTGKTTSATDEVKQYLKNQDTDSSEKLELPQELLELASQAEKDGVPNESLDSESETEVEE